MNNDIDKLLDNADLMVLAHRYEKAMAIYNKIIEINCNYDEAYLLRGELYHKLGQTGKALDDVLKALSIDPDYGEAYNTLALLYQSQGNLEKSIEAYKRAIKLNSNKQKAIKHIIQLCVTLADKQLASHQPDKAADNYQLAVSYDKNNLNLLYRYAFTVSRTGDFELAIKLSEDILAKDKKHIATKSLLISLYEKIGEHEKGWEAISALVQEYPDNPFIGITFGKYALRNNQQALAINKLQQVLKQTELKVDDRLSMHMLVGKLYDSISDYENAFTHFSQANKLKYNGYDIGIFEQQITKIIKYFSKEKYSKLAPSKNQSTVPIFILGMPRSGTSLVEQIISSHSRVYGGGELHNIPEIIHTMEATGDGLPYPQLLDNLKGKTLDSYAEELLNNLQYISPDSSKVTDKLPHNFLFISLICKLFPNAKIINCLRNPIDNCLSCYFQHFGGYHPYSYNLTDLGKYYLQYARLMKHWEHELNLPIFNVRYESLVENTHAEVESLLDYLELEWEDNCMGFYKKKRSINTASYTQVNQQIYTDSINRWQNYEPYIGELINLLSPVVQFSLDK